MDKILDLVKGFTKGSWKTSVGGILTGIAGLITFLAVPLFDQDPATTVNWTAVIGTVAAAFGIYQARDDNRSSEDVGNK